MIKRIFSLVKRNALNLSELHPVTSTHLEEIIIEASSSIIDGIKNYLESGKFGEVLHFFRNCPSSCSFEKSISNKFANRLGKFYDISMDDARLIASTLIPTALADLAKEANTAEDAEFSVVSILSYLNGQYVNFNDVADRMTA